MILTVFCTDTTPCEQEGHEVKEVCQGRGYTLGEAHILFPRGRRSYLRPILLCMYYEFVRGKRSGKY